MITLREYVTAVDDAVAQIFNEDGFIHAIWHTETAAGEKQVVPVMEIDKDLMVILMRAHFMIFNVVRYVFVDEAWQVQKKTANQAELDEIARRGVRNHPDRVEVIMYQAEDSNSHLTGTRLITRPKSGKPRLGPLEFFESNFSTGRFVGLLPQRGTMQ